MKVSIITPSYNQGQFIERTIKSVLNQKYPDLEYIVIDGGSTDNTVETLKRYNEYLTYWISEKDKGQSNAFNKGYYKSTGEIIGWLNSDDIYYDNAIQRAVEIFKSNPGIDVVFSNYHYINNNDIIVHSRKEIPFNFKLAFFTKEISAANAAGFFRRNCFEKFGLLREDLQYGMDQELYMRLAFNGCKFKHVKDFWAGYRLHEFSKSVSANDKQKSDAQIIFNEYYKKINPSKLQILFYPVFYKYYRYFKKFLTGCYSFSSVRSSLNILRGSYK